MHASSPTRRYALLSITHDCVNRGNLIIEHATREVLGLGPDVLAVDAHRRIPPAELDAVNARDALILPGATLLQPEDHAAAADLPGVTCPVLPLGVAMRSALDVPDDSVARLMKLPVGSRDPFTHRALVARGIPSRLVGCQTLLLGAASRWREQDGPIVVSLGLGDQAPLEACVQACADVGSTVVLAHAPGRQRDHFSASDVTCCDLDSAEQALALLRRASVVVTGRIHAMLACITLGTPAIFLGGWFDSRYSLLEHLGVPVEPPVPARIRRLVERARGGRPPPTRCLEAADALRRSMRSYLDDVARPLGLCPPPAPPGGTE
ncbi:MAG: polysaccharide pyruvyl transferase family protein [Polyangiaceae bacterium]|nr:polysaccharide pyruvyl transferase family protein [Polyangiaceae bacterium]